MKQPVALSPRVRNRILAALALLPAASLNAQSTFVGSVSGQQWGTAANWSAGVPNAVGAEATLAANGGIANIAIGNHGLGYVAAPSVTFASGSASASAILSNRIAIIHVTDGGSGYTSAPTVTLSGGSPTVEANAVALIDAVTGKVTGISIQYGGYGFSSAPTVTLSGGGGTGATAEAFIAQGVVGFNVASAGTYASAPNVTISAPPAGTTATATTTLNAGAIDPTVVIGNAGAGYVVPPAVTFSAPPSGGTRATGYATISGGAVTGIVVTHPGTGYTSAPTVSLTAPVATATATAALSPVPYLDNVGGSYPYTVGALNVTYGTGGSMGRAETAADMLRLAKPAGVQAVATATLDGEQISNLTIVNAGSGYTVAPTVTLVGGGGSDALIVANINELGEVTGFTINAGGFGYTSAPTVVLSPPDSPVVNVSQSAGSLFLYATLTGNQGFTKAGPGTLTFRFNGVDNTLSGPIRIDGGSLVLQQDGSLGAADNDISIAGGAKLGFQPSTNLPATLGASRAVYLSGPDAQIGNALTYPASLTIAGPISGPGGLRKVDGGPVILTGENTYLGNTNASGGVLVVPTTSQLPGYNVPGRVMATAGSNGTLAVRMGGPGEWTEAQFDALLTALGTGGVSTSVTSNTSVGIDTTNATGPVLIDGLLNGDGLVRLHGFGKSGPGVLELTGVNTYTGPTRLWEGTLRLGTGASIDPTARLFFNGPNAVFDIGSATQTVATVVGFGGGTASITGAGGSLTIASDANFTVNLGDGTVVDFSGLTNFTFNQPTRSFLVQPTTSTTSAVNTLNLPKAGTSSITAATVTIGAATGTSQGTAFEGRLGVGASTLVNATTFNVGGFNGSGLVSVQSGVTNPSLSVRGLTGGSTRIANWKIGETSSGVRSGAGVVNLASGSIDALVDTLALNRHIAGATNGASSTLSFGGGTIDANTVVIGEKVSSGTPTLTTTVNQTGGVLQSPNIIVGRSLDGATLPANAAGAVNFQTTYNLAGGTLKTSSFAAGVGPFATGSVRTLAFAGGTLTHLDSSTDLNINGVAGNGGTIRLLVTPATTSTLQVDAGRTATIGGSTSLVAADASAVLVKAGAGSVSLNGLTTGFLGTLRVDDGAVFLGNANSITTVNAGSLIWNGGTLAFDLSELDATSDTLVLVGALSKGTGVSRQVDLKNVGVAGTYTLATYASTDLVAGDLTAVNVPGGLNASFNVGPTSLTLTLGSTPVLSLIETWRLAKFGTSEDSGSAADSADPDFDGRTNLMEYATGSEPLTADAATLGTLGVSSGKLTLTFNRIADPSLTYTVRASSDLTAPWNAAASVFTSTLEQNVAGPVTATDTENFAGLFRRFLRLEVTR